ncbi:hypothetical protein IPA_02440 [Ignicoccus pacificus DSM 13166]|uniref:Uncharacterized protein n=1 Tax=Ignicoccus pacificus DSM 13166 TaxID=940294 RepID=A0A977KAU1_9CREN|nr:hypothetical protein IPA_02440 [Ignicoccus pacificus DSM 13166]
MKFLLSLVSKELEDVIKDLVNPFESLLELYTFKDAKQYESKLLDIASALGVPKEEASDLNALLKKLLESKK